MKKMNRWPAGLIIFYIIFIIITISVVIFTTYQRVDLVSDDYYEQEIRYQQQINRQQRADSLSAPVTWIYHQSEKSVILSFPPELEAGKTKGSLLLFRPSDARLDLRIPLRLAADNSQTFSTDRLLPGLWKIKILWESDSKEYYTEGLLII